MAEQIELRNQEEELRKVFRIYDDDDNMRITRQNLERCAEELQTDVGVVTKEQIDQMVDMADRNKKGYVDIEDFIVLMRTIGLISEKDKMVEQVGDDPVLAAEQAAMNERMARK